MLEDQLDIKEKVVIGVSANTPKTVLLILLADIEVSV